jgi:hypothetical protein
MVELDELREELVGARAEVERLAEQLADREARADAGVVFETAPCRKRGLSFSVIPCEDSDDLCVHRAFEISDDSRGSDNEWPHSCIDRPGMAGAG